MMPLAFTSGRPFHGLSDFSCCHDSESLFSSESINYSDRLLWFSSVMQCGVYVLFKKKLSPLVFHRHVKEILYRMFAVFALILANN